ncbi:putative serine esterase-domain-containing protein [Lactifluus volemus]|nr:putative serine esterase-domain-containing protein [Lactifluus volemus]
MSDQTSTNVHLLVLIHGMWGNPSHLASMHRIIQQSINESSLHVMLPETNRDESTYDGIDWGGERVATEIFQEIEKLEKEGKRVTRFSITGYSLGGLLARYVVGILYQREFFSTVTPVNFNTMATPHIGLLLYPSIISKCSSFIVPRFLSRTGEQFYGTDQWSTTGKSLLEVMADPEHVFYRGLKLFLHIRIYANAINDLTVPYMTAYVDNKDPFINHTTSGLVVDYDDTYYPIVKSFDIPDTPPPKRERTSPRPLTVKWFKSYRPPLPPRFQAPFPFNIVSLILLPILFPTFLSLVIVRLSISSHHSRSRIKLLETEDASTTQRLIHVFAKLEPEVEDIVADMEDDPAGPALSEDTVWIPEQSPPITPAQRRMMASLNALPQLKKERVYIPDVRNSHATIIARDIKNFEFHKIGEGVLRHWADVFVM